MRLITLCMVVFSASIADARDINVADHGILPGGDVTYALNRLLDSVRQEDEITIVFPQGQYEFYPENAVEQFRAVSNHDNSLKRIAFWLQNFRKITIDGGGSRFMFHGRISPIVCDGVSGVTLKDFSIDWSRPFHDELPVVASNESEKSFIVQIDRDKYPCSISHGNLFSDKYDWQDRMGSNIVFDPATRAPIYNTRDYSVNFARPHTATSVGKDRVKLEATLRKAPPPVGSVLISYGTHPTSRLCPAIHLANSSNVTIEGVTIHAAGGMGVIAERTENIRLSRVTVSSTDDRLVSTRADATHFLGCKGLIRLDDCLFEHMLDDAVNVHGAYIKVEQYLGNHQFLCEISHFQQWGLTFAAPGDRVALLSRQTVLPFFQTTVKHVNVLNQRRLVLTLDDVPDSLPEGPLSVENLSWHPDLVMKNNIVRENRARSMLVTTKGSVLIEDNYFSSQMHGILIEGDNNKWYESGAVQDVTITGNVFENSGFAGGPTYPLLASPLLTPEQRSGEGHYHRNIRFVNNTVKSFNGHLVSANSVKGLTVTGNKLQFSSDYPAVSEFPAIQLQYCTAVNIRNNEASGFGRTLAIAGSPDTTNVNHSGNVGIEFK